MPHRAPAPRGGRGNRAQTKAASRPATRALRHGLRLLPLPAARRAARAATGAALPPPTRVRRLRRCRPRTARGHQKSGRTSSAAGRDQVPEEEEAGPRRSHVWVAEGTDLKGRDSRGGKGPAGAPGDLPRLRAIGGNQAALRRHPRKPGGRRLPPTLPAAETPRLLIGPHRAENLPPPLAPETRLPPPPASPPPPSAWGPRRSPPCLGLKDKS